MDEKPVITKNNQELIVISKKSLFLNITQKHRKKCGYGALIIWESDFVSSTDLELVRKIRTFIGVETM